MASGDLIEGSSRGRKGRRRRSPPKVRQVAAAGGGAPTMSGHILEAVGSSRDRRGLSLAGVKKALSAAGYDVPRINSRVNQAVRSLVSAGSLLRTAGAGASGSFKINRQHHQEGQNRPVAAAAAASPKSRGRQRKAAPTRGRKRSPVRRKKPPRGGRKKGRTAGGRRKAAKGTGVRRPGGRIRAARKATKEPLPGAEPPPGGQGAQPQSGGGESGSEEAEPGAGERGK
ncbi:histone H1-like [Hemiscyllium ocellatum]|uniref:histone H1-like n=1 Tax=Hemiscyllium ocellatum TaxID=170820 RepID=UPI002967079E|nr:histone H1-like [Hemiscyllium ocellatum]